MNLLWLILIIPGYLMMAGYMMAQYKTRQNDDPGDFIPFGLLWPLVFACGIICYLILAGALLHRPERRRLRDKKIREHEAAGRQMDDLADRIHDHQMRMIQQARQCDGPCIHCDGARAPASV